MAEYQPLLEVETDKAAVEIPSPKAGTISRIHVEQGQTVKVGAILISIDEGGDGAPPAAAPKAAARPELAPPARPPSPPPAPPKAAAPPPAKGSTG